MIFNIGKSTVKEVIAEVCNVLCEVLVPLFLRFPTPEQFQAIADDFMADLHFPNCVGALDGKHCRIEKPKNSGSLFFNYKHFYSVVLMACCDSKKRFIWMNLGDYGSFNDAGIFANSDLGSALTEDQIQLPLPAPLPNTQMQSPHFFIGDGGFPLKPYLMKPFIRNENLTMPHRAFNYRLSHARRIIENAFRELTQTWLVHERRLNWKLSTTERILTSTICLHNIRIDVKYNEVVNRWNNVDNLRFRQNIQEREVHMGAMQEHRIREQLCEYFVSPAGSVPWQWARM